MRSTNRASACQTGGDTLALLSCIERRPCRLTKRAHLDRLRSMYTYTGLGNLSNTDTT